MTPLLDAARDYWERLFARDHPAAIAPLFAVGRWALVLARKLHEHRAFGRAAQMAYATLAALVPLLLFAFGVVRAVAPGADLEILEQLVFQTFLGNIEPIRAVLVPGLEQVDLTTLGALSTAGLLVVAANLYLTAESAYSEVFEVEVDRPLTARLLNFYLAITVGPVAIAVLGLTSMRASTDFGIPWVQTLTTHGLPFCLLVLALKLLPATRVHWKPALLGGAVSAVLIHYGTKSFRAYLDVFVSESVVTVVYGSLALVPVFLFWLYLLWVFVLLGVEIAHVAQRLPSLLAAEAEARERDATVTRVPALRDALAVAAHLSASYEHGQGPLSFEDLARRADARPRDVVAVLAVLERDQLVTRTTDGRWVPTRPSAAVPLAEVAECWRRHTGARASDDPAGHLIERALADALTQPLSALTTELTRPRAPTHRA